MKYQGTIAYRANSGGHVFECFTYSLVRSWHYLLGESKFRHTEVELPGEVCLKCSGKPDPNFHLMRGLSCTPSESAQQIVDGFLGEWVLMLDTDHMFSDDALFEMVKTFEGENHLEKPLDVLVGFTQKRQPPYEPVIYRTTFNALENFETIIPQGIDRQYIFPVDSSGAACLMVRRKVFDEILKHGERPFEPRGKFNSFNLKTREEHGFLNPLNANDLPPGRFLDEHFAEDTSFFWRCQMLGIQPYCAPWIKFHHIETRLVTEALMVQDEKSRAIPS